MNPYEVLGVRPDDDEETIKKAYRNLVKKYHPDKYVNTPMADMASEKMKQINEAYDMIMNNKNTNNGYNGEYGGNYGPYGHYGPGTNAGYDYSSISFETVRRLISARRIYEAEIMLDSLPRDAQWYYLMGLVYINKGWYNQGTEYIKRAVQMDPGNIEYQSALNNMNNNGQNYKNVVFNTNGSACGICSSLCASWFLCRCCCGC